MLNLDRVRIAVMGIAAGLLIAVFYLRRSAVAADSLNELRDGAIFLVLVSVGLSIWQMKAAKTHDLSGSRRSFTRSRTLRLPVRNYLTTPLTIFIEPVCDQFEVAAGGEAHIILEDGHPHSIDVHPDNWVSIWNEGAECATVEVYAEHQFPQPKRDAE